jgi:hypothetical protein
MSAFMQFAVRVLRLSLAAALGTDFIYNPPVFAVG